jgi:hypothetical protein
VYAQSAVLHKWLVCMNQGVCLHTLCQLKGRKRCAAPNSTRCGWEESLLTPVAGTALTALARTLGRHPLLFFAGAYRVPGGHHEVRRRGGSPLGPRADCRRTAVNHRAYVVAAGAARLRSAWRMRGAKLDRIKA